MNWTAHTARRTVATLATVLIAGLLGMGAVAGLSSADRRANSTVSATSQDGPGQPRLMITKATSDDHPVSVDLPAGGLALSGQIAGATLIAITLAMVVSRVGAPVPTPSGRAPPCR